MHTNTLCHHTEYRLVFWYATTDCVFYDEECTCHPKFGCMLSIGTIHFEDRFCAGKKVGEGEMGGWVKVQVSSTWQLPWLAVERSRLALAGPLPF